MLVAFAFIAGFSMAQQDKSTDLFYNNDSTTNRTVGMMEKVTGSESTLFIPIVAIGGIVAFGAAIMIFRRR